MKNQRGQVTIFIIVGVLIVVSVLAIIYFMGGHEVTGHRV